MPQTKLRPRLAVGTPFQPEPKPVVQTQGPATLIDEATGQAILRVGDRLDGQPEVLSVEPMAGAPAAPAASGTEPVSMASGGYAVAGGGYNPLAAMQLNDIARRRMQLQGIQAATNNVGDIAGAAQAQFLRNDQENPIYTALGVSAPVGVDLPADYSGPVPAGVRGNIRTSADVLTQQAQQDDALANLDLEQARLSQGGGGGGAGTGAVRTARAAAPQTSAPASGDWRGTGDWRGNGGESAPLGNMVSYTDPFTHITELLDPVQATLRKAQADQKINDIASGDPATAEALRTQAQQDKQAKAQGQEVYTDPWTGARSVMSGAQASIQKMRDQKALRDEFAQGTGRPLDALSDSEVVDELVNSEDNGADVLSTSGIAGSIGGAVNKAYGLAQAQVFRNELHTRGFSDQAIQIVMDQKRRGASNRTQLDSLVANVLSNYKPK